MTMLNQTEALMLRVGNQLDNINMVYTKNVQ